MTSIDKRELSAWLVRQIRLQFTMMRVTPIMRSQFKHRAYAFLEVLQQIDPVSFDRMIADIEQLFTDRPVVAVGEE